MNETYIIEQDVNGTWIKVAEVYSVQAASIMAGAYFNFFSAESGVNLLRVTLDGVLVAEYTR